MYRVNEIKGKNIFEIVNEDDKSDVIEIETNIPFNEGDLIEQTNEGWCMVDRFAELLASNTLTQALQGDKNDPEVAKLINESKKDLLEASENRRVMSLKETIDFVSYRKAIQELTSETEL